MEFSVKFKWYNRRLNIKDPFNGEYITALNRVPNIGEYVCFDGTNQYKVVGIVTRLKGWKTFHTILLE